LPDQRLQRRVNTDRVFGTHREFWRRNREFNLLKPKSSPDEVVGTHRRPPQGDVELMAEKQILSFERDLNMSATNIPSPCRITNIGPNDVMILPHDANPCRIAFSERTTHN
jgi:hypothetical protein